jgi:predicted DsbA family dithiol-disulfide isomerase
LLESLGVTVTALPYELHPEIPVGGISLEERWGSRHREAKGMYARIEAEAEAAGLPFSRPARVPNTRRALKTAEWVRRNTPGSFAALDRTLFETHFVENRPLDDPDVLDELVNAAGADAGAARSAVEAGAVDEAMRDSMDAAMDANVTGTPTWLLDGKLMIPGVQPRELFEIWVARMRERAGG